jgi:LysR family hydrogen peroxide-inducible transcriptional activator
LSPAGWGISMLNASAMEMVANGCGETLVPEVVVGVEAHDDRVKLMPFVEPEPVRTVGLAWRRTSPRKSDFAALGRIVSQTLAGDPRQRPLRKAK